MKPCLQPTLISSSFSFEKLKCNHSQDLDQGSAQSSDLFTYIPDSTSNLSRDEAMNCSKDTACIQSNLKNDSTLHKHVQSKLENNEIDSVSTQDEHSQSQNDLTFDRKGQILYRSIDKLQVKRHTKT